MSAGFVSVKVESYGVVRMLAVSGDLDLTTAAEFAERSARAAEGRPERFVLDLSRLRFVDCCGARALTAMMRTVPDDCPVIVRAAHPAARRMLDLLGLDLERRPQVAGAARGHTWDRERRNDSGRTARRLQIALAQSQQVMTETRMLAGMVAATEDRRAIIFSRLAEQRPVSAKRLSQLSEAARREAAHLRDWTQVGGGRAALGSVVLLTGEAGQVRRDVISASETRDCEQCGAVFTPRREHARFCSCSCRDSWNRERGRDAAAGISALTWTVTAMRNVTGWLAAAGAQDRAQAFEAISEAVWWVTIVDATLNRHHLQAYESVICAQPVAERQLIEETLVGLRFVRNQAGRHAAHANFIEPVRSHSGRDGGPVTAWSWRSLPEPTLIWLAPRRRAWEMTRYRAYEAQLAGHSIGETFGRAAAFLKLASARAIRPAPRPDWTPYRCPSG